MVITHSLSFFKKTLSLLNQISCLHYSDEILSAMIMLSRDNLVGYAFVREGRGLLKQVVTSHDSEKQSAI